MSHKQSKQPASQLRKQQTLCQSILTHGAKPDEPKVEDRQVRNLRHYLLAAGLMSGGAFPLTAGIAVATIIIIAIIATIIIVVAWNHAGVVL